MKVKKESVKSKKKKSKLEAVADTGIKKVKKTKKLAKNAEVVEEIKKEYTEQADSGKKISVKHQTWYSYLKVFLEKEKLNLKQKQMMEFCTGKSLTPPRRRKRFLNFIRNCYEHQKDVTDEQVNELFDMVLKKYDDFKAGNYASVKNNSADTSTSSVSSSPVKLSKNKKKKLKRQSEDKVSSSVNEESEDQWEKTKAKKRKKPKKVAVDTDDDTDDDD